LSPYRQSLCVPASILRSARMFPVIPPHGIAAARDAQKRRLR